MALLDCTVTRKCVVNIWLVFGYALLRHLYAIEHAWFNIAMSVFSKKQMQIKWHNVTCELTHSECHCQTNKATLTDV